MQISTTRRLVRGDKEIGWQKVDGDTGITPGALGLERTPVEPRSFAIATAQGLTSGGGGRFSDRTVQNARRENSPGESSGCVDDVSLFENFA